MNILVVGDGDLSFSRSLVQNTPTYCKVFVTCLEDNISLYRKYSDSKQNIEDITKNGGIVITNVDATKLENLDLNVKFDLIIFNFPHTGGKSNIKRNRKLLSDFFASVSRSDKLLDIGVVCVTLCKGQGGTNIDLGYRDFKNSWQIEENAAHSNFLLFDVIEFNRHNFPIYSSTGYRSQDKRFLLEGSRTYAFKKGCKQDLCDWLLAEVWLNNEWYYTNNWIVDVLQKRNTLLSDETVTEKLTGINLSEVTRLDWQYVFAHSDEPSYRLLEHSDELKSQEHLALSPGHEGVLCSSFDQQIAHIIETHEFEFGCMYYTSGFCFYPTSKFHTNRPKYPCQKFLIVFACDIDNKSIAPCTGETINIVRPNCVVRVKVHNLSTLVREKLDVDWSYQLVDMEQQCSGISQLYRGVFLNNYTLSVDQVGLLLGRSRLNGEGFYRDISFWCGEKVCGVDRGVEEIVRCVFGVSHWINNSDVLEQYEEAGDKIRIGLCMRMYLRAADKVLDRGQINRLQSCVRIKTQNLLNVELR